MFNSQTDRPLSRRGTTIAIGVVVAMFMGVGLFSIISDRLSSDPDQEQAQEQVVEPQPFLEPQTPPANGAIDEVDGWFPHSRGEFAEAGGRAADFVADVATVDSGRDDWDSHTERVGAWATDSYAVTLTTPDGIAEGPWRVLARDASVAWTGAASVTEVTYFDPTTVTFVVAAESEPNTGEEPTDLGEYGVTMTTTQGGGWRVERAEQL
ncbi:hypothetical protein NE857_33945 (plasmid) [Nocardiopsis exhalans]|uniref:Uncharacterized protein n=1 Tax=Nocardiopsis exhalans TaxID=163604 RepID=A0ABY5DGR5_9ACTN|nr:hypothetical protein [Nocardiopsis exhalans]USY23537.1 hypothetical protein NE857_33945 [Nocardiopsis exhalans]